MKITTQDLMNALGMGLPCVVRDLIEDVLLAYRAADPLSEKTHLDNAIQHAEYLAQFRAAPAFPLPLKSMDGFALALFGSDPPGERMVYMKAIGALWWGVLPGPQGPGEPWSPRLVIGILKERKAALEKVS